MILCETHFTEIKAAIVDRGLWKLVKGRDVRREYTGEEAKTEPVTLNYNPLERTVEALCLNAVSHNMMSHEPDGCPLCFVEIYGHQKADSWIKPCADAILKFCQKRGLTIKAPMLD